jgi:protein-S-isoprenylcysteine O-methyltransferase Ste14
MNRTLAAAAGSILWFFLAPGSVAGAGPWLITGFEAVAPRPWWAGPAWAGWILIGVAAPVLVEAFVRFVRVGRGTPTPVLATERLVVTGLYRCVRNPMYVAVVSVIVGESLVLGSAALLLYAAAVASGFHAFVRLHEEPSLRRRFGSQYDEYCRHVRRWRPGRPWSGGPAGR